MSKNITVLEGKKARNFSNVKKLRTNLVDGKTQNWIPEDEAGDYVDLDSISITENGTYTSQSEGVFGFNEIKVEIDKEVNLITKDISENGTYNASDDGADGFSSVSVNVAGGGGGISGTEVKAIAGTSLKANQTVSVEESGGGKIVNLGIVYGGDILSDGSNIFSYITDSDSHGIYKIPIEKVTPTTRFEEQEKVYIPSFNYGSLWTYSRGARIYTNVNNQGYGTANENFSYNVKTGDITDRVHQYRYAGSNGKFTISFQSSSQYGIADEYGNILQRGNIEVNGIPITDNIGFQCIPTSNRLNVYNSGITQKTITLPVNIYSNMSPYAAIGDYFIYVGDDKKVRAVNVLTDEITEIYEFSGDVGLISTLNGQYIGFADTYKSEMIRIDSDLNKTSYKGSVGAFWYFIAPNLIVSRSTYGYYTKTSIKNIYQLISEGAYMNPSASKSSGGSLGVCKYDVAAGQEGTAIVLFS